MPLVSGISGGVMPKWGEAAGKRSLHVHLRLDGRIGRKPEITMTVVIHGRAHGNVLRPAGHAAEITTLVGMFAITERIVTRLAVHQRQRADLDNVATVRREFANVGEVRNVRTGDTPEKVVGPPPHLYADVIGPPAPAPVEGVVQTGHSRQWASNLLFPFRRAELAIAQLTGAEACVVDEPDHPIALDHLGEEIVQEGRSK